ncbi:conserved Plasmodium protein, unknown function [Plasmodium knowlesi strain H]|uniref:Uncharacterized protein n=3 Tax=Plasmodium knowlesi TaxID=5850 RepID=A0A5K1U1I9_PLAKH|nr:conserved Plasmodium protein, unknown function [Plasmodium knowlesi strain H]OTN68040.1 Uncharacterized protein PKNOH_S04351600 [Plasmodium knowlesi]CAA9990169.1 conserved Plasmodium protein, unknown function [Plasmodium knowlesi strain H]SBO27448.1 conserved Plasmodium protein, unknown function [Plasmodium knowlesi strain H]SBO28505.1 conserved Plasmodium protein, unknown function [Plasmodium knowlesi strain H]VVS79643.1 conserved Plasmodium protein, unknown function [Plasmodium knowlesi s|eukprot:XP_002258132.1 hypothetical protein, conserved in Plasmodium species [Plasmodium knowlesi strain H]
MASARKSTALIVYRWLRSAGISSWGSHINDVPRWRGVCSTPPRASTIGGRTECATSRKSTDGETTAEESPHPRKAIKLKKQMALESANKVMLSKLNLQIEQLDCKQLMRYKNVKNVITLEKKKEILSYLNSYLLRNNKAKYYILSVLMFRIVSRMSTYQVKELIYVLHAYKENNFLSPFLMVHIMNKLGSEEFAQKITLNEFLLLVDTLTVPLIMPNSFAQMIQRFICKNMEMFKCRDYFLVGYFLARNNLYNDSVLNFIAEFYRNFGGAEKFQQEERNNNHFAHYNDAFHSGEANRGVTTKDNFLPNGKLTHLGKDIHKHIFILSKYGYNDIGVWSNLFRVAITQCRSLQPLEISSILKSLKNMNYYNSYLFEVLVDNIRKNLSQYKTSTLMDCLNSLSYFNHVDDRMLSKILVSLPRRISTYTANDFTKLIFFINNFTRFSSYFILFANKHILLFASSFNMLHLVTLLKIFAHQNLISQPILHLLNVKLEKFISSQSSRNCSEGTLMEESSVQATKQVSLRNLFEIIHIMNFMSVRYPRLAHNCLESMFTLQGGYKNMHPEVVKCMTYCCCYFMLVNDQYGDASTIGLHKRISDFFSFLDSSLVRVAKNGESKWYDNREDVLTKAHTHSEMNHNLSSPGECIIERMEERITTKNPETDGKEDNTNGVKKQMDIDIYAMIIRTFLTEFIYLRSRDEVENFYNLSEEHMKRLFFYKIDAIREFHHSDGVNTLKKLLPLVYYPHVDKSLLKNVQMNRHFLSTYSVGPTREEKSQLTQSEHVGRQFSYHQKSLNEMYQVLKDLPQTDYKFNFVKNANCNSVFLYIHYIFAKRIHSKGKVAILFGTQNYYYTTVGELYTDLHPPCATNMIEEERLTKEAIAQIHYFKLFFDRVHLVPAHLWENMNQRERRRFFVTLLDL